MKTFLISFYSDIENKTYYSNNANRLREECKSLDIQCSIQHKESLGSYRLNCLSKPQFILDKLLEIDQPLVWMDVDSRLHKSLQIFDKFRESDTDMVVSTSNGQLSGMKASPLYFGNTDNAKEFIGAWIKTTKDIIENDMGSFDHEPLFSLIPIFIKKKMDIKFIGPEYCMWPGYTNDETYITMGLADSETKKENLRKMGLSEDLINIQSLGDVE